MQQQVDNFISANRILCIASLGLAIVGFMGYHSVRWLINCCSKTKKIQTTVDNILQQPSTAKPAVITACVSKTFPASKAIPVFVSVEKALPKISEFQKWKDQILKDLPNAIARERDQPNFARKDFPTLNEGNRNCRVDLSVHAKPTSITHQVKQGYYYPFNADAVADFGFGCAWRSTQICLSRYLLDKTPNFEELFHLFGPLENLKMIYKDLNGTDMPIRPDGTYYAPYTDLQGWAEPLITQLALHFYGISSKLMLLYGLPDNTASPAKAFKNPVMSFQDFVTRIKKHFENPVAAPIMIDNSYRAMTIIGYGTEGENIHLKIADPHIKAGVSKSPVESPGIFTITLDKTGKRIDTSCDFAQTEQLLNGELYPLMTFQPGHPWIVLFPDSSSASGLQKKA